MGSRCSVSNFNNKRGAKLLGLFLRHIRNCGIIRRLLRQHPTENLQALYWYDLPLQYAVSWPGILKVCLQRLVRRGDKLSASWGMQSIYFSSPPAVSGDVSHASVWHCHTLDSSAWHDGPNQAREQLERHADALIEEYRAVSSRVDTHPDNADYVSAGKWNGLFVTGVGGQVDSSLTESCPVTTHLINDVSVCRNFGFVAYSQLLPGTRINPHVGSSNLRLRLHLGVDVPEPEQVRIRVGEQWRQWKQGAVLAFDDSYDHEVEHNGTLTRTILMVDVWHPGLLPEEVEVLSHPVFGRFGK
jgi:hypothetical protein